GRGAGEGQGRAVQASFPVRDRAARDPWPTAVRQEGHRADLHDPACARAGDPSGSRRRRVTGKRGADRTENSKVEAPAASEIEELDQGGAHASSQARPYRKALRGYVVSDKMDKTVVVEVEDRVKHARYGKVTRKTS